MKKIKLFLITLLCMVGVMNAMAEVVVDSPHAQIIDMSNGVLGDRNYLFQYKSWYSNDGYDLQSNPVKITADTGSAFENHDGLLLLKGLTQGILDLVKYTMTIEAPEGWCVTGLEFDVVCNDGKLTAGGVTKTNGHFDIDVNSGLNPTLIFDPEENAGIIGAVTGSHNAVFSNFIIKLQRRQESPTGFLDNYGNKMQSGVMYTISAEEVSRFFGRDYYSDAYFGASENNSFVRSTSWPASNHFVNVDYAWEVSFVDAGPITLQSLSTKKYVGKGSSVAITADTKVNALKLQPEGPKTTANKTPYFYNLKDENSNYLSYANNREVVFSLVGNVSDYHQYFCFHRVDYVRLGVFSEGNGVLNPLNYSVTMRTGDDPLDDNVVTTFNDKSGQEEICYEHSEDKNGVVTRSIKHRITAITATNAPTEYQEIRYVLNGVDVDAVDYTALKSGDNLAVIYVLEDTPIDPVDPDPIVAGAKFYKLKSKVGNGKYLSVQSVNGNSKLAVAGDSNDAIFYYEYDANNKKHLLSYTSGVYVKGNALSDVNNNAGSDLILARYPNSDKWDVKMGVSYLTCNSVDGVTPDFEVKPSGEYELVRVEKLPVVLKEVNGHRYGTFYAPVDVKIPAGLEAYRVVDIETGTDVDVLRLVRAEEIPANTGVILYEETATSEPYSVVITTDDVEALNSKLDGVCPIRVVGENETLYGLNVKNDVVGFYQMRPGKAILSPFRAYLDYTSSPSKGFAFSFDETDMVEAIEMSHNDNTIYDLQGRRVQNPGTGIYIVNGKKIMITK